MKILIILILLIVFTLGTINPARADVTCEYTSSVLSHDFGNIIQGVYNNSNEYNDTFIGNDTQFNYLQDFIQVSPSFTANIQVFVNMTNSSLNGDPRFTYYGGGINDIILFDYASYGAPIVPCHDYVVKNGVTTLTNGVDYQIITNPAQMRVANTYHSKNLNVTYKCDFTQGSDYVDAATNTNTTYDWGEPYYFRLNDNSPFSNKTFTLSIGVNERVCTQNPVQSSCGDQPTWIYYLIGLLFSLGILGGIAFYAFSIYNELDAKKLLGLIILTLVGIGVITALFIFLSHIC
jgi:hypothetical protein